MDERKLELVVTRNSDGKIEKVRIRKEGAEHGGSTSKLSTFTKVVVIP